MILVLFFDKSHISKKTSVVTKIGRDCQQGWPPGAVPHVFCPQKRVGSTGVLVASIGGKFVPHGQTFWQHAHARRHHRLRVNSFKQLYLLIILASNASGQSLRQSRHTFWQSTCALDDHGVGMELAALSAQFIGLCR